MSNSPRRSSFLGRVTVALVAAALALVVESRTARADDGVLVLVGLGLVGGGLVAGAPGAVILGVCREGEPCHSTETQIAGWVLLAPGIPGILVGTILIGAGLGSTPKRRSRNTHDPVEDPLPVKFAITAPPPPPVPMGYAPSPTAPPSGAVLRMGFSF